MDPLISVVIPVYNVQEYLETCVKSVCGQSYKNLEIILVDDGSSDNSGQICDLWAKKDERILVIHKENGGLSDARNRGLQAAKGEWITFVDSDDIVSNELIQELFATVMQYQVKLSICDVAYFSSEKQIAYQKATKTVCYTADEALCEMMYKTPLLSTAWGKLYHRSLFIDITFPKGKIFEDVAIMYRLFAKTEKKNCAIVYVNAKRYAYRYRKNSITTKVFDERNLYLIQVAQKQLAFAKTRSSMVYLAALVYQTNVALYILMNAPASGEYRNSIAVCEKQIKENFWTVMRDRRCRKILKASLLLFQYCKPLFRGLYRCGKWVLSKTGKR